MIDLKDHIEKLLKKPINSLVVFDAEAIVQLRIARLKLLSRPSLGPIAGQFGDAIKLTQEFHRACNATLDLFRSNDLTFSNDEFWKLVIRLASQ